MKLMRLEGDRVAEIVEVADTVSEMTEPESFVEIEPAGTEIVEPARDAVLDEAGVEIMPAREAVTREVPAVVELRPPVYVERASTPEDFYHPNLGFIRWEPGAVVGHRRAANGWSAPEQPERSLAERREIARGWCSRLIMERASANTQANMTAYATVITAIPAASRTAAQKADLLAYAEAIAWVGAMRARWPQIAEQGLVPGNADNWPQPTEAAMALAARF